MIAPPLRGLLLIPPLLREPLLIPPLLRGLLLIPPPLREPLLIPPLLRGLLLIPPLLREPPLIPPLLREPLLIPPLRLLPPELPPPLPPRPGPAGKFEPKHSMPATARATVIPRIRVLMVLFLLSNSFRCLNKYREMSDAKTIRDRRESHI